MSLLIKALDKAQAEKATKSKLEQPAKSKTSQATEALSLEAVEKNAVNQSEGSKSTVKKRNLDDVPESLKGSAAVALQTSTLAKNLEVATAIPVIKEKVDEPVRAQAQAANVFTAKQADSPNHTAKLAVLIGLIALSVMGALAYWYQSVFNAPEIVIPPRPLANQEMPEPLPDAIVARVMPVSDLVETLEPEMIESEVVGNEIAAPEVTAEVVEPTAVSTSVMQSSEDVRQAVFETTHSSKQADLGVEETLTMNETVINSDMELADSSLVVADLGIASKSASIKMTKQKTTSGVNPVLMRAYEAYNAGNDSQAQQDYMQVLKQFGPNVDAMLGLGAIATRQERLADANGWYRQVLEVEPRNELAKSGLLNLQQGQAGRPQASESNIKSMIATAPNDANLHAALGDLYANQQQWPAAQQAYFDAYRLNQSVENAFNLGVSLDQLGKPALALPYYREALQKAAQSNAVDAEALKARIASIE